MKQHMKEQMKKMVVFRPEGWAFSARAGAFHVWHAGKNDYRVTREAHGDVIRQFDHLGLAFTFAQRQHDGE